MNTWDTPWHTIWWSVLMLHSSFSSVPCSLSAHGSTIAAENTSNFCKTISPLIWSLLSYGQFWSLLVSAACKSLLASYTLSWLRKRGSIMSLCTLSGGSMAPQFSSASHCANQLFWPSIWSSRASFQSNMMKHRLAKVADFQQIKTSFRTMRDSKCTISTQIAGAVRMQVEKSRITIQRLRR